MCVSVQVGPSKASCIISIPIHSMGVTNDINNALVPVLTMAFVQPSYSVSLTDTHIHTQRMAYEPR